MDNPLGKAADTPKSTSTDKPVSPGMRKFRQSYQLLILFLPCFIYYVMFVYIPMFGISISFMDYKPFKGFADSQWVGFKHYLRFFTDPYSWQLVRNTFLLSFFDLLISFPATIVFALIVNEVRQPRLKKAFQTITYMPHFISVVVIVGMLKNFLNPSGGMLFKALQTFGMPKIDLFTHAQYFRTLYISSGIWQNIGWNAIIYYAALSNIDPQLYESAVIDGANKLRQIIYITLPSILPTIVILFVLRTGSLLTVGFDKAFLMQTPATYSTSDVISTYVYRSGLAGSQFSYSSAVGVFNAVVNLAFVLVANLAAKKLTDTGLF